MGESGRTRSRLLQSRLSRKQREIEFVFVPEDVERTIKPVSEDDVGARRRHWCIGAEELNELSIKRDGPVIMDLPGVLKAEDVVEVDANSGAVEVGKSFGMCEALVVVIDEEGLENVVCVIDGGDVLFAQVFDETILLRAVGSFDTALGLRGVSVDEVDTESSQGLAESG
jgi:arginine repressor